MVPGKRGPERAKRAADEKEPAGAVATEESKPTQAQLPIVVEKKTTVQLQYKFTPVEISEFSHEMARLYGEQGSIQAAKQAAVSEFKARLELSEKQIADLARKINNGTEYRDIPCILKLNCPAEGKKTLVRLDTNEEEWVRDMEYIDRQQMLFPPNNGSRDAAELAPATAEPETEEEPGE